MHLNLFIIEDEEAHFVLMKRAISKDLPHSSIRYFANARTCLEALDESEPDIIITDYLMPEMNGLEFLEALNREGRDIPVVMITGQGDERIAVEAMKSGAWDYLVKTADFFTLIPSVIRKVFREKALKDSVKKSERRFQDVAEQTSEWLWEVDAEGTCVYSNPVVEVILGYTPSEIVGKSLWELFPPKEGMSLKDSLSSKTNPESTNIVFEHPVLHKEGRQVFIQTNGGPFFDHRGNLLGYRGIHRDITERKRNEEALQSYAAKLETLNRELEEANEKLLKLNKEMQEFVFAASHDLQEPLRKIQVFADLLADGQGSLAQEQRNDYFQRLQSAAGRMRVMIDALLAYSRITTRGETFTRVALSAAAGKALKLLDSTAEEAGARVEVDDLPEVEADLSQMVQLFHHLLDNALTFHRKNTSPEIRIYSENNANGRALILVEDNGIGFDENYLQRIFIPFERLHGMADFKGTGIGLAICRKVVERHGGTITAKSTPGRGSTFIIDLPVKQERPVWPVRP
jgi:two-component system, LuxR family, sensor kinase FixL